MKGDKTTLSHGYTFIPTDFKGCYMTGLEYFDLDILFLFPAKYLKVVEHTVHIHHFFWGNFLFCFVFSPALVLIFFYQ